MSVPARLMGGSPMALKDADRSLLAPTTRWEAGDTTTSRVRPPSPSITPRKYVESREDTSSLERIRRVRKQVLMDKTESVERPVT